MTVLSKVLLIAGAADGLVGNHRQNKYAKSIRKAFGGKKHQKTKHEMVS